MQINDEIDFKMFIDIVYEDTEFHDNHSMENTFDILHKSTSEF